MFAPPNGTVTFLFTDMEGSTRLWESFPDQMPEALARHDTLLRTAFKSQNGYVFKTMGDSFCVAFAEPLGALVATIKAQIAIQQENWQVFGLPAGTNLKVRMALHTGAVQEREGDYFGPTLNRIARILTAAHGGQVLLSQAVQGLICDFLPPGVELRDLGSRRLKDLPRPEQLFQLLIPCLPSEFPPLRTLDERPQNLPAPSTSFVGRTQEAATVRALLRRPMVRLVTLTGPGGTGKTRLSLQVARDLLDEFENGVFFVALAVINDPSLVVSTIAQTLGVKEKPGQVLLESLKSWLREKSLLLVLDNFEQVVEAAPIATELLMAAPQLKILVSSREILYVYGEHEYEVPPLNLPDLQQLPPIEELEHNEAVNLFVQRAQAFKPSFNLNEANAPLIAEICSRLDGLPLAIELAAVRSRQLTPVEILNQLNQSLGAGLDLLSVGPRDLPGRQRTLRGAIDWSYQLLNAEEKRLFERLAVFSGGWSASAADAVCNDIVCGAVSNLAPGRRWFELWTGLNSLNDKSLIREVDVTPAAALNDAHKAEGSYQSFVMLQTIREFALERLAVTGELETTRRKHAFYYLELVEIAEPELKGPQQVEWTRRLDAEHDNLRAALSWLLQNDETEAVLKLAAALRWFWQLHNYLSEGRRWLELALAKNAAGVSIGVRAKTLNSAGVLAYKQADYAQAITFLTQSLELQRELQEKRGLASTLINLGTVFGSQNDYIQAQTFFKESLDLYRELGDKNGVADTSGNLGVIALYQGSYAEAQPLFEESLALQRELANKTGIAGMLNNLGCIMLYRGEYERGAVSLRESLALFQELGDKFRIAEALEGMAGIFGAQQDAERAARLFGAAESLRESIGAPLSPSDQLFYEPILDMTHKLLGEAAFEAAWQAGRALSLEEAISFALVEDASTNPKSSPVLI